ncbi:hypothetical protein TFLX_05913 [Thermoflexales bacterium]|nr:hypothetical protein TFLX_05913 [Thermoflexales bacterium]
MLKNIFYSRIFMAVALLMLTLLLVPRTLASPSVVTFTVDSVLDQIDDDISDGVCHSAANQCTLRAAIMQANVIPGPGVTIILPSGTYTLTRPPAGANGADNGDLNLASPASGNPVISIVGAGAASTLIDANKIDRVLSVGLSRRATISGVTIRNGFRQGAQGGGVSNSGLLTITDCVIEGNQTDTAGGGIYSPGTLNITRSTLRANVAYLGGGLHLRGDTTIRDSSFYGNAAGSGGGIAVSAFNADPHLYIVNSTISQNYANTDGGGIDSEGSAFLYNTSVINNDADHDRDQIGGIGGGVYVNPGSRFVVVNTLIAGNTILDAPIYDDCHGTLEVYGWNLLGDETGCTYSGNGTASRGFIALNTIGPLQDNGGPTWTQALLPGSAAIDTTLDVLGCVTETGALLTTDQRGAPRPAGTRCDVGAFEFRPLRYLYLPLVLR